MNGLVNIGAILAMLLVVGGAIGLSDRKRFSPLWLLVAAGLVLLNDFLLTRGYGALPNVIHGGHWNWQGKILALTATLAIAALPAFGWTRAGLMLKQARGSLRPCLIVAGIYAFLFLILALITPNETNSVETIAFQLTLPGLEEEPFYRGLLLLALDRAFAGRVKWLGVEWGWGAVLSCALFGLAHAFDYKHGHFSFDAITMAVTALPSFIAVWIRYRSGSVVLPIVMHNFGNSIPLLV